MGWVDGGHLARFAPRRVVVGPFLVRRLRASSHQDNVQASPGQQSLATVVHRPSSFVLLHICAGMPRQLVTLSQPYTSKFNVFSIKFKITFWEGTRLSTVASHVEAPKLDKKKIRRGRRFTRGT